MTSPAAPQVIVDHLGRIGAILRSDSWKDGFDISSPASIADITARHEILIRYSSLEARLRDTLDRAAGILKLDLSPAVTDNARTARLKATIGIATSGGPLPGSDFSYRHPEGIAYARMCADGVCVMSGSILSLAGGFPLLGSGVRKKNGKFVLDFDMVLPDLRSAAAFVMPRGGNRDGWVSVLDAAPRPKAIPHMRSDVEAYLISQMGLPSVRAVHGGFSYEGAVGRGFVSMPNIKESKTDCLAYNIDHEDLVECANIGDPDMGIHFYGFGHIWRLPPKHVARIVNRIAKSGDPAERHRLLMCPVGGSVVIRSKYADTDLHPIKIGYVPPGKPCGRN